MLSPVPAEALPDNLPLPEGSWKYALMALRTWTLLFSSHNTIKSAIIAVTKSA